MMRHARPSVDEPVCEHAAFIKRSHTNLSMGPGDSEIPRFQYVQALTSQPFDLGKKRLIARIAANTVSVFDG